MEVVMVMTTSTMPELGTEAPDFSLPDTQGNTVTLSDFKQSPALLVIFMCNHCPFVKHILSKLVELIQKYQEKGVAVVGINSNDAAAFPEDRLEMMAQKARELGFTFPYLYDETQKTARAYQAACTPDFFLFDNERKLVYRGQMDNSRPGNNIPVTGADLSTALDAALEHKQVPVKQKPSMGCNIKWKRGNAPDYSI
jgi:peroxiredoxin